MLTSIDVKFILDSVHFLLFLLFLAIISPSSTCSSYS